jgi:hypothetical protein
LPPRWLHPEGVAESGEEGEGGVTKPIRYVLDKPKEYFINTMWGFEKSKATPVKLGLYDGEDFFFNHDGSRRRWSVTEARTGMSCGGRFETVALAKEMAISNIKKQGLEKFHKMIRQQIGKYGLSPRYRKEGGK